MPYAAPRTITQTHAESLDPATQPHQSTRRDIQHHNRLGLLIRVSRVREPLSVHHSFLSGPPNRTERPCGGSNSRNATGPGSTRSRWPGPGKPGDSGGIPRDRPAAVGEGRRGDPGPGKRTVRGAAASGGGRLKLRSRSYR